MCFLQCMSTESTATNGPAIAPTKMDKKSLVVINSAISLVLELNLDVLALLGRLDITKYKRKSQ